MARTGEGHSERDLSSYVLGSPSKAVLRDGNEKRKKGDTLVFPRRRPVLASGNPRPTPMSSLQAPAAGSVAGTSRRPACSHRHRRQSSDPILSSTSVFLLPLLSGLIAFYSIQVFKPTFTYSALNPLSLTDFSKLSELSVSTLTRFILR